VIPRAVSKFSHSSLTTLAISYNNTVTVAGLPCGLDINSPHPSHAQRKTCGNLHRIHIGPTHRTPKSSIPILERSNSGQKVSIRFDSRYRIDFFDSIRQSDKFAVCTRAFQFGPKSFDSIRFSLPNQFFRLDSIRQSDKFAACTLIFK